MVDCASLSRPLIGLFSPLIGISGPLGHPSDTIGHLSAPLPIRLVIIGYSEIITAVAIIVLLIVNISLDGP